MKKIFCILLTLLLTVPLVTSVSAVIPGYGLYVGGIEVTAQNAADVLGDGTVSYDAEAKTLTLNNANITGTYIGDDMFAAGIYADIPDLTVKLVGENRITIPIASDSLIPDGSEVAIVSLQNVEISGTGKLWSNTYVVLGVQDLVIKDCEISTDWICLGTMGDVTVESATISGKEGLVSTEHGNITLKNTTVPDGGNFMGIYTETGDITIESCNVTIYGATAVDEATIPIALGEGGGTFTVKDSVLDLKGNSFAILSPVGSGVFENVSGKIETAGNAAYAMMFGGNVSMKGCDLEISCRATDDAACGISTMGDINIEESTLKIETRTTDESAICIGGMESPNTNVNVLDSTLELKASGPNAVGFYTNGVKLQQSITKVEAAASATGTGFAAGVVAGEGRVLVNGGQLEVLATGPAKVEEGPTTACILMGNEVLVPELIGADVKLIGNQAICAYPDLTLYGREYGAFASNDVSGAGETDFTKENIEAIRFLHIYPLYEVKIDGNGGEGEMFESELLYGEYTLPENAFTAPDGKHFRGWSLSADGDLLEGESIWLRDDITLYAIWESEYEETTDAGGETTGGDHTHDFGDAWKYSADGHYKECACGEKQHSGAHTDSNGNGFCDVCGGVMPAEGLGAGAIVGIVVAAVLAVGLGGFAVVWFAVKKKTLADLTAVFRKK